MRKNIHRVIFYELIIALLPLLLEILGNMYIVIICLLGCDAINFEINCIFLIKSFSYMFKNSWQNFKDLKNKKCFWHEKKHFLSFLKRFKLPKIASDSRVGLYVYILLFEFLVQLSRVGCNFSLLLKLDYKWWRKLLNNWRAVFFEVTPQADLKTFFFCSVFLDCNWPNWSTLTTTTFMIL